MKTQKINTLSYRGIALIEVEEVTVKSYNSASLRYLDICNLPKDTYTISKSGNSVTFKNYIVIDLNGSGFVLTTIAKPYTLCCRVIDLYL